ncbi:FAD-binding oxidoreductase [Desulfobaculum bizertense]|uniref:Glycolate oxidase n=1 Tax=Desulfobaculum bizertense DSM 18034 TaxID=1121442 RepID=A0A1T4VHN2_9BACT|nr:FAD-linked oxidase C-terminal domain-containing protein [Desulfobaculum bizertense]UIJ37857.1 FAD-binding protein [Desulfobaculum bizertense]SKA64452.1 glycolate oxidase [Desulfobaculum bizertense DSM 18034]
MNDALIKEFQAIVGKENVLDAEPDRQAYAYDSAVLDPVTPELVVRPNKVEELGRVLRLCNENGLPITPRGAGSNLSGGTIPKNRGVVVLTNSLNRILEINEEDMYAVVEPGVVTAKFAAEVASRGLFYPPDPGSQAVSTLAGNIAENAGGLRGLKYGVTKDYVMGVDFFDVNGDLVKSGSRTVKCVTGFNLSALQIAGEGSLGVIAQAILKLVPPPAANRAMMAIFDSIDKASETVAAIIANKIVPCTLELMDQRTIELVEDYTKAGLPTDAAAILLIEVDGHPAQVADEAEMVVKICGQCGATTVKAAKDEEDRFKIWEARRAALPALARARPTTVLEDATVPRSQIPAMIRAVNDIAAKYNVTIGTFGHAGDGNLHPTILCDRRDHEEFARVEDAVDEIFDVALSLKGTLSGEHGIGLAKAKWLEKETSRATIDYAKRIKAAVDPKGILNPGKIIGA